MSYYAALDDKFTADFASNTGMADFGAWVDSLDADTYPELVHLREYGWDRDLPDLQTQLPAAVKEHPPEESAASVADGLAKILASRGDAEVLTISDGAE